MPGEVAVELDGVSKVFGEGTSAVTAPDDVTLHVERGEFVAVMGPSGSGKSTLLHLVAAMDQPTSGELRVGGRDIGRLRPRDAAAYRRQDVGIIFQAFNLLPRLTALENVALPLLFARVGRAERMARAAALLHELGMEQRARHRPPTLSGGEKQRVAIARALIGQPLLLLADEPTGNLDSGNAAIVLDLLGRLHSEQGQTILLITHDAAVASRATRTVQLRDGRFLAASTVSGGR